MILQVGVKAVLKNSEGKILLLERSERYGVVKGSWDVPGGRIDPGTTLLENLNREILEETRLQLTGEPFLIGAQDIMPESGEKHIVRLTYVATTEGEPVLDGTEHTSYRWVSFEEMRSIDTLDRYLLQLIDAGTLNDASWRSV